MKLDSTKYYENYWQKRTKFGISNPIPNGIPLYFQKFTAYGAILNCIPNNSEILDLGCGDGNVSQLYLQKGKVTGVDISETALKISQKRGIKTVNHNLNELPLPFRKESFDVIILTDVLEHLFDPYKMIIECKRIVKKNGKIIITVPNFARVGNRIRMIYGDPIDLLHFDKYGDDVEHFHWFTIPKIIFFVEKAGFENYRFVPTGLKNGNFIYGLFGLPNLGSFITIVLNN
jgi:methionine biosynthesis protein MetW